MVGAGKVYDCGFDDVLSDEAVAVAITLTPGSSPGQALGLTHEGFFAQLDIVLSQDQIDDVSPFATPRWMDVPSA